MEPNEVPPMATAGKLPEEIGGFQVLAEIFSGGMSTIYHGRDPSGNLDVAIKLITRKHSEAYDRRDRKNREQWSGYKYLKGITWEGEILANLNHPHIVHLYEHGRIDGQYYIIMEHIPSRNLHELNRAMSPTLKGRRLKVAYQFAHALLYVHRMGIIHRDVCPRNVLLDKDGRAKLIDFGLAIPKLDKLKDVFYRSGTPSYMAPEVIRSNHYDFKTDIYAFGISLYELFTGRTPFGGEDEFDRVAQHLSSPILPPTQFNPAIPESLERIIIKAVEKNPDRRYPTMQALVRDLEKLVARDDPSESTRILLSHDSRRLYQRIKERCYMYYYVKRWMSRGPKEVAVTDNISPGGIGFHARTPPQVGTILQLEIQPRVATTRISATGRVVHVGEPGPDRRSPVGVEFIKIARRDRERFQKYIKERKTAELPAIME